MWFHKNYIVNYISSGPSISDFFPNDAVFHCCNKLPENEQLRERWEYLPNSLRGYCPRLQSTMTEEWNGWSHHYYCQEYTEFRNAVAQQASSSFPFSLHPAHRLCCPSSGQVFHPHVNFPRSSNTDTPWGLSPKWF